MYLKFFSLGIVVSILSLPATASVVINEIHYNSRPNSAQDEFIELHNPGDTAVDLSGWFFSDGIDFVFPLGSMIDSGGYLTLASTADKVSGASGVYVGNFSSSGERVRLRDSAGLLVDSVNYKNTFPWPVAADGSGASMELVDPSEDNDLGGAWRSSLAAPTPGSQNSVFSDVLPPHIRQVAHTPTQPASSETVTVRAKVTDGDGVASVVLRYQVVAPGSYISSKIAKSHTLLFSDPNAPLEANPDFEDPENWNTTPMIAGAGGEYSVTLPAQPHRTLVRYRFTAADSLGNSVRVPYEDDESLNFAYFSYDGVPGYAVTTSLSGPARTYPPETMRSLPVYHVITTDADFEQAVARRTVNQIPKNNFDARSAYNWTGTFVYDGKVYDHIGYRLRQRNARYSQPEDKRSFRFKFNRGYHPQFHDDAGEEYPTTWRTLSTHKMTGSRGMKTWGLEQAINNKLWNNFGTPASFTHYFQMRVIARDAEATSPTSGDFYGMGIAVEEFNADFLDSHNLPKGNLYKLISNRRQGSDVRRYQAAGAVSDGSDFENIINQLRRNRSDAWLREHVDYDLWFRYHTVKDAVRHYDMLPNTGEHLKNRAHYYRPSPINPLGQLVVLPWDSDTSWGPNWNTGEDFPKNAAFGSQESSPRPQFLLEYRNVVREFRDLVWTEEQIDRLIDPLANYIAPLVLADRDRWNARRQTPDRALEDVVADMKKFAFEGGSWVGGNDSSMPSISRDSGLSGRDGRDAFLDALARDPGIPGTPVISSTGPSNFPQYEIAFAGSPFADPQGTSTAAAAEWWIGSDTGLEIESPWREIVSGGAMSPAIEIPSSVVKVGDTYRARVRYQDDSGRWSHFSDPLVFTVTAPRIESFIEGLVISEINYDPPSSLDLDGAQFEFIELLNVGATTLNLSELQFSDGVEFHFTDATLSTISPGQRLVIVGNVDAFNERYGFAETPNFVIGAFGKNLSNESERLALTFGADAIIRSLRYRDESPWPVVAPDSGNSIVLVAGSGDTPPEHALPASWRLGLPTPGSSDSVPFPGGGREALLAHALGEPDATPEISIIGGIVEARIPRKHLAEGVGVEVQMSTDLSTWLPTAFGGWTAEGSRHTAALPVEGNLFLRIKVDEL